MTNLSSPAAEAAEVSKNMSDVIDSLKRLERVGSENSKTTQKLIEAARSLEDLICMHYQSAGLDQTDTVVVEARWEGGGYRSYSVRFIPSDSGVDQPALFSVIGRRVSESRDAALAFSKDIAEGLIDLIAEDLAKREEVSRAALGPLEGAIKILKAKQE